MWESGLPTSGPLALDMREREEGPDLSEYSVLESQCLRVRAARRGR